MPRSRLLPLGLASGVALTLAACQDNSNTTGPDPVPPSARVQASQGADLPPASEFARHRSSDPDFWSLGNGLVAL